MREGVEIDSDGFVLMRPTNRAGDREDVKEVLRGVQGSLDASKAEDDVTRTMRELCKLFDDTVAIR